MRSPQKIIIFDYSPFLKQLLKMNYFCNKTPDKGVDQRVFTLPDVGTTRFQTIVKFTLVRKRWISQGIIFRLADSLVIARHLSLVVRKPVFGVSDQV